MNAIISLQQNDTDEEKDSHTKGENLHRFNCLGTSGMLPREPDYSLPRNNGHVSNSYKSVDRDDTYLHAEIGYDYDVNGPHEIELFIFEDAIQTQPDTNTIQLDALADDVIWEIFSFLCANDFRYEHANEGMLCEEEIERTTNTYGSRRNKNTLCDSYGTILAGFGMTSKANQCRCLSFLQEIPIVLYTSDLLHVQKMAWLGMHSRRGNGNKQIKVEELILSDVTSENVQYFHCMLQHVLPCDLSHLQYLNTNIDLYMEEPDPISMQDEELRLELLQAGISYECIQNSVREVTSKREFVSHLVYMLVQRGANIQYLVLGVELEELDMYHLLLQYNSKMLKVLDLHILESEGPTADTVGDGGNSNSDDNCTLHDNLLRSFDNCFRTIEGMPNLETLYLSSDEILDTNKNLTVNLSSDSLIRLDLAGALTFECGSSKYTCSCACPNLEIFNLRTQPIRSSHDLTAIATLLQHCSQHLKELRLCFDTTYGSASSGEQPHCHHYDLSDILMNMPQLKKLFLDECSDCQEYEMQSHSKCQPRIKVRSNSIEHLGVCGGLVVDFDHPYPYTSTSCTSPCSNLSSGSWSSSSLSGIKHLDFYGPLSSIHELISILYAHSYGHGHGHNSILSLESIDICINCLDDGDDYGMHAGAHCKLEQLQRMVLNMTSLERRTIRLVGYACIRIFKRE